MHKMFSGVVPRIGQSWMCAVRFVQGGTVRSRLTVPAGIGRLLRRAHHFECHGRQLHCRHGLHPVPVRVSRDLLRRGCDLHRGSRLLHRDGTSCEPQQLPCRAGPGQLHAWLRRPAVLAVSWVRRGCAVHGCSPERILSPRVTLRAVPVQLVVRPPAPDSFLRAL